jgi:hypothetical protein
MTTPFSSRDLGRIFDARTITRSLQCIQWRCDRNPAGNIKPAKAASNERIGMRQIAVSRRDAVRYHTGLAILGQD